MYFQIEIQPKHKSNKDAVIQDTEITGPEDQPTSVHEDIEWSSV